MDDNLYLLFSFIDSVKNIPMVNFIEGIINFINYYDWDQFHIVITKLNFDLHEIHNKIINSVKSQLPLTFEFIMLLSDFYKKSLIYISENKQDNYIDYKNDFLENTSKDQQWDFIDHFEKKISYETSNEITLLSNEIISEIPQEESKDQYFIRDFF